MKQVLLAGALLMGGCEPPVELVETVVEPIEVRATVDRAVATTGDLLTYAIEVEHDPGLEVRIPESGTEIAGFRIVDLGREQVEQEGRTVDRQWYSLRADLVGSYVLPAAEVLVRDREADDDEWETHETSRIFVEVESVLPGDGEATDIRDIKPVQRPPVDWTIPVAIAVAVAIAVIAVVVWLWRRREAPVVPMVPAHEVAFAALAALRGTDFDDLDAMRAWHFSVSEVIRAYVEDRFGMNATDLTTEEIIGRLVELAEVETEARASLKELLLATDRVKFAAYRPVEGEIEACWDDALGFVERTVEQDVVEDAA